MRYWEIVVLLVVVALARPLAMAGEEGWRWINAGPHLRGCKTSLKNIGTALEMYSTDNCGRYPLRLSALVPRYLKSLPTCPAARYASYRYERVEKPDYYTITCVGGHCGQETTPTYRSVPGIIEDPVIAPGGQRYVSTWPDPP